MIFKNLTIICRPNQGINDFIVFGSNNNFNWNIVYTGAVGLTASNKKFLLNNTIAYAYYRISIKSSQDTGTGYVSITLLKWETI
jgi:hypothetical protein